MPTDVVARPVLVLIGFSIEKQRNRLFVMVFNEVADHVPRWFGDCGLRFQPPQIQILSCGEYRQLDRWPNAGCSPRPRGPFISPCIHCNGIRYMLMSPRCDRLLAVASDLQKTASRRSYRGGAHQHIRMPLRLMHGKGHGSSCRYSLQLKNLEQRRLKSQSAIPKPSGDMIRDDFIENHHEKSIALRPY